MLTPVDTHHLKSSESNTPIDAPMPITTEQELFNNTKKKSLCSDCFKRKTRHSHKLTRYENDGVIIQVASKNINKS
jgi:hypothetical protein